MKFTVVTVTYDEEYPLLLIQARSIVEYVPSADLEEVIFIKNCGREATKNSKYFEKAVKTLLDAGLKVRVLHRDDFEVSPELSAANGWKDQQAMKILVANDIATDHYLLLDTKNFFTRRTGVEQLFMNGKAITFKYNCSPVMRPYLEASAKVFDVEVPEEGEWIMPTATPYLMDARLVREMLDHLDGPFDEMFYSEFKVTEFFLYFSYLKKFDLIEKFYTFVPQYYATFFATYPSAGDQMDRVRGAVESSNVFSVGIHRKRFLGCSEEFKNYLSRLWCMHGLVNGPMDFNEVFDAMSQ